MIDTTFLVDYVLNLDEDIERELSKNVLYSVLTSKFYESVEITNIRLDDFLCLKLENV